MIPRGVIFTIKRNGSDGIRYPVTTETCIIGRGINSDIRIHLQSVSEEHCKISISGYGPLKGVTQSFRWEYLPDSPFYVTKIKGRLPTSPLRGSSAMVGMPNSMIQSTLSGNKPFQGRSLEGGGFMTSGGHSSGKNVSLSKGSPFSPSERLVAIVSPQRRSTNEKKSLAVNQTPPSRVKTKKLILSTKKSTPVTKSARNSPNSTKKGRNSVTKLVKTSPQSARKTASTKSKKKSTTKVQSKKRKLDSDLLSAERAAKRLKLESPKTPDKNKMAALLVCHGKSPRTLNKSLSKE
ncbi:hypothetical protein C0J52_08161 [Blattella germanica]|nr:hypothetical protein C0J52_08161 [Blattella germanica]